VIGGKCHQPIVIHGDSFVHAGITLFFNIFKYALQLAVIKGTLGVF